MITVDEKSIVAFRHTGFGWLKPDGTLVACRMYEHFFALDGEYGARYKQLVDHYNEEMHKFLDEEEARLKPGEYYHPEMHRFNPESDAAKDIEKELYSQGYIRLGSDTRCMEAYGVTVFLELQRDNLEFIFDVIGFDTLSFTVQYKTKIVRRKK